MPPGRAVVSDSRSLTRNVSNLVDYFLKPICEMQPSYLLNSGHLIALLRATTVSHDDLLFTMDVESLYTSVPITEGVKVVSDFFLLFPDTLRPDLSLITLLKLLLTTNDFNFRDSKWLQTSGVAMGKSFGGSFANLFMAHWETSGMANRTLLPKLWKRYQDDVFGIWSHGEATLRDFFNFLNAKHNNINLTLSYGKSVHFLDLTISIGNNGLTYEPYTKAIDSHTVLPPSSHHPLRTFRGIIFGETLRFATHSASRDIFEKKFSKATRMWRKQGYTRSLIREVKKRVITLTGQTRTWPAGSYPCEDSCRVCRFTTPTFSYRHPSKYVTNPIFHRIDCNTTGVIYVIKCTKCEKSYVGETGRSLRRRISEHLDNIGHNVPSLLASHFRQSCSLEHFTFHGVKVIPDQGKRRQQESHLIALLNTTHPQGLNTVTSRTPSHTNLILPFSRCAKEVIKSVSQLCGPQHELRACFYRSRNLKELLS